jgi:hypothetical protein
MDKSPIGQLVERLERRGDSRVYFWREIKNLITLKKFESVWAKLSNNQDDCDYDEQCILIGNEIAYQYPTLPVVANRLTNP